MDYTAELVKLYLIYKDETLPANEREAAQRHYDELAKESIQGLSDIDMINLRLAHLEARTLAYLAQRDARKARAQ